MLFDKHLDDTDFKIERGALLTVIDAIPKWVINLSLGIINLIDFLEKTFPLEYNFWKENFSISNNADIVQIKKQLFIFNQRIKMLSI